MPTLEDLERVARGGAPAPLTPDDRTRIAAARAVVDQALGADDAAALQLNLVRSHAVGAGAALPEEVVRGMLALLAASLRRGHSGVREEVVELLLAMLEHGVVPVVPAKGSVGSSGDLAPLAHIALVLVGEGEADVDGERLGGAAALARVG